jgi:RNA polymerase sigma factor (sigma-70 family)
VPQHTVSNDFLEYRKPLLSFVRKRLPAADEAEDIVQDIFYQLSRINSLAKPIEQTAAWLFRVARNLIINRYKKKRDIPFSDLAGVDSEDEEDISDITDILGSDETTPETGLLRSFIWAEIESAIDELPPPQREIFIQTEFLDLPVKKIAKESGIPVNTLLSRKHYAVVYLRKRLRALYTDVLGN